MKKEMITLGICIILIVSVVSYLYVGFVQKKSENF